jgi:hypothetical protein
MKTKLQRTFSILLVLLLALALLPARSAQAQVVKDKVPVGLMQAILDSTTQSFHAIAEGYTASASGLTFDLATGSLQAQAVGFKWGLSLHGFGRSGQVADVSAPELVQTGDKLEYQRTGLTEWYLNTALGLEQGFTIFQPPPGSGPLVLQLDLATDLKSVPDGDGGGLSFPVANGQTLRYDHLLVWDANGVALNARLVSQPGQVILQVNDSATAYPLTIDPLIYLQRKVVASDGAAGDQFGNSVALSGDTALVGAPMDNVGAHSNQGSAYVFVRSGTTWSLQKKLTASDGAVDDQFGNSVALSGDTALVGAHYDNVSGHSGQGSAYVFVRSGTTWSLQKKLTASDGAAQDLFGTSVALSGNTALVGAFGKSSAYVFVRSVTTWSQQKKLTVPVYAGGFGSSVALSGDTALVGADLDNVGANSSQGSAYIFVRSGTAWSQQAHLIASDGNQEDNFGNSVALSGDTALVGAIDADVGGFLVHTNQGSAYVFVRSGTAWSLQKKLTGSDSDAFDYFGSSVALSGNTALVGANEDAMGLTSEQGSAYIFVRSGTVWSQQAHLTASDGVAGDHFGYSVALSGSTALVGAYSDDVGVNIDQGSAYVYQPYHELALNGGFNTYVGTSKIPQYWTAVNFATTDGKDIATKKEGAASLKIVGASGKTKTLTQTKSLNGASGHAFQFSLWVKGVSIPSAGLCQAQVLLYNGTTLKLTKTVTCPTGTYAFTKKSLSFTTTSVYTKAVIKITYAKASGTVNFDAMSLMKAP